MKKFSSQCLVPPLQSRGPVGRDAMARRHPLLLLMRFVRSVLLTQIATTLAVTLLECACDAAGEDQPCLEAITVLFCKSSVCTV
jgi:hypothetical protein